MFDVFYFGPKPNLFEFEKPAHSLEHAAELSRTGYCWYIYGGNDYSGFDFDYTPAPWESTHVHVWPSQWQKNGWVYLVPKAHAQDPVWNFRSEQQVKRLPTTDPDYWYIPSNIDKNSFDFSWHPDPHEPDYEYHFGTQWQSAGGPVWEGLAGVKLVDDQRARATPTRDRWNIPVLATGIDLSWHPNPLDPAYIYHFPSQHQSASGVTYTVPGAIDVRLVDDFVVKMLANQSNWSVPDSIAKSSVDYTWHPNPLDPAYIYHFPSQHQSASGVTYSVPGATEIKPCDAFVVKALDTHHYWSVPTGTTGVDYSWHPNPLDPAYIYHFPSRYQSASGVTYSVPGATEIKLCDAFMVTMPVSKDNWSVPAGTTGVDYSWRPNPLDPAYIYHFASQWQASSGVTYTVAGATEIKLCDAFIVRLSPSKTNWSVPVYIDESTVDYTWQPDPLEPPYIYHFASQWQLASGVTYTVPGATEIKSTNAFIVKAIPNRKSWTVPAGITGVDYSWHPNPLDPDYEYHFPTQWSASSGVVYNKGGGDIKFSTAFQVKPPPSKVHWTVPDYVDASTVDYTWQPDPLAPPYIYHFASQHQTASGVTYAVPGATEIKLCDAFVVKAVANKANWNILRAVKHSSVDWSWHPDVLETAYRYHFPDQWQRAGSVVYETPGATEDKLIAPFQATVTEENTTGWSVPAGITGVDRTWHPDPFDPPYIYHFPSQWQASSGVTYTVPGATEIKLINPFTVKPAPDSTNWTVPNYIDANTVDMSWQPDPLAPPYIYHFASQWQSASGVTYTVPGATEIKLCEAFRVTALANTTPWTNTEATAYFDYSWHPDVLDPAYIYEFATQWHDEGGPVYCVPGATEHKYIIDIKAQLKSTTQNWHVLYPIDHKSFNWTWAPHPKDPPYIYVWGNDRWPAEKMPTVEYCVPGATEIKYMDGYARLAPNRTNWQLHEQVDADSIDYTWYPDPQDPPYIYEFATQHQPNGGARYVVPGATEVKYVDIATRRLPDSVNWEMSFPVEGVDYSWHPDNTELPYIYEFATQWQPNGGARYVVPGATEIKYVDLQHRRLPNTQVFAGLDLVAKFDSSWHPDNTAEPYVYVFGNQHWPAVIMPTVTYTVSGATQQKFVDAPVAQLGNCMDHWELCEAIDHEQWDWSWVPNPLDPPYIYVFGNQWNPPEYKASVRYCVPGATEIKYMPSRTVRLPQPGLFETKITVAEFDYSWEPNPFDPPMNYVFGNQWNSGKIEPTVIYPVKGATETKYIENLIAQVAQDTTNWEILDDVREFDYSWRPDPTAPAYIYVFGNQWMAPEQRPAVRYTVSGATDIKYMDHPVAVRHGRPEQFVKHYNNVEFDYSWEPDPGSPPYTYVFGNQWWPAEIMPTVEYRVPGATETKYMDQPVARLERTEQNWVIPRPLSFDFDTSWCPDPGDPPYIYVFGNQHYPAELMSTIEYHVPGATERKFVEEPRAKLLSMMDRWNVPEEVDADNIDFTWHPHPKDEPYIHHFGTEHQMSIGLTYTVPGATELKFEGDIPQRVKEKKVVDVLDIFFVDRSNAASQSRFERLQAKYPKIQKVRYANSMMATIRRCATKARTSKFWVISSEYNYDQFDFTWHAQPWQSYMTHVFPSQHQKWSDTFLINRWEFERHSEWAESLEQFPNLNFVKDQTVTRPENVADIFYVDHGNPESRSQYERLLADNSNMVSTRFVDNYLDTFRRIMAQATTEYVWIINSVCDYAKFDFTWQPEPWQREMIHCFPSGGQERGDTFYIHVESFQTQMIELELLDWFNVINYCTDQTVNRFKTPVHVYNTDDLVAEVQSYQFETPYVTFTNQADLNLATNPCLWTRKDRTVLRVSTSGATALVPRDIKADLKTQIYDYPYIETAKHRFNDYYVGKDDPGMDIVYISNGEPDEQRWYEHLCYQTNTTDIEWVRGVNGRTAAYQEAARRSRTPWFFAVFAKLEVTGSDFPWHTWAPDYFQEPKHYIFNARNPVNGLEYGHQGVIAYNRRLVLENNNPGIDFTLSQAHESVPILSGTAHFNQSAWMTWRTAFREVVKLKLFVETQPTLETEYRLKTWLTQAEGAFAEDCLAGARDAVAFYDSVAGNPVELQKSFEWAWLQERYSSKKSL